MHGRRSASDAKARTRLHSKLQGDQVKAPATLHRVFPHRSHCPIAHGDPVSYMSKIRYENGYKWRRKDKERGREREVGKGEQKGKKREEKRSRKIQETRECKQVSVESRLDRCQFLPRDTPIWNSTRWKACLLFSSFSLPPSFPPSYSSARFRPRPTC